MELGPYQRGYKDAKQITIEKVCNWLRENLSNYEDLNLEQIIDNLTNEIN